MKRILWYCLGATLCAGSWVEATELHIAATIRSQSAKTQLAVVEAVPVLSAASPEEELHPVTATFEVPGETRIPLEAHNGWRLSITAETMWAPTQMVLPGEESAHFTLLPTVEVGGSLVPADEGERPEKIEVSFRSAEREDGAKPSEDSDAVEGRIGCDIAEEAWKCRLPVGTWDLRLRSPGFISHFFWALEFKEGEPRDLGVLAFERGSAVFGRVTAEDGEPPSVRTQVTAEPAGAYQVSPTVKARVASQAAKQPVDERGFFHLKDLAPGSYNVTAAHDGYLPAKCRSVAVEAGTEVELDDLVLKRPLTFEVRIIPATDPTGKPWRTRLRDRVDGVIAGRGVVDEEGRWRLSGLAPGPYDLGIATGDDDRIHEELIDLRPAATSFDVEVSTIRIEGTLQLGDEPLSGTVYFGGRHGSVSIPMASDEEGRFTGWTARAGDWKVDVLAREPKVFRRLPKVEIHPDADGVAEVEIVLPDMLLEGEVVDEEGRPLPTAVVVVGPGSTRIATKPSTETTDEDGRWSLHGNAPGTYRLEARARLEGVSLISDVVEATVSEEAPVATTRLVVRRVRSLRGQVVAGGRGVAGASVILDRLVTDGVAPTVPPQGRTGIDGGFALEMASGIRGGWLMVFAPGYVLYSRPVEIRDYSDVLVDLEQTGGRLVLRSRPDAPPRRLTVTGDGFDYDYFYLARWSMMNGIPASPTELVVPAMPAGAYTVCWTQETDGGEICRQGSLVPAQEWVLDLTTADNQHKENEE